MQRTGPNPAENRGAVKTKPSQLRSRDHSVLPTGDVRYYLADSGWWGIVAFFATNPNHLARVAAGA
jgi:hypothetical protein